MGNYLVKGGYKEYDELASAVAEPIIAEPEIHGGIELDDSCRFLLLMSRGLYKSLEEATGTEQVNKDLALMAVEQVLQNVQKYIFFYHLPEVTYILLLEFFVKILFVILVQKSINSHWCGPSCGRQDSQDTPRCKHIGLECHHQDEQT